MQSEWIQNCQYFQQVMTKAMMRDKVFIIYSIQKPLSALKHCIWMQMEVFGSEASYTKLHWRTLEFILSLADSLIARAGEKRAQLAKRLLEKFDTWMIKLLWAQKRPQTPGLSPGSDIF